MINKTKKTAQQNFTRGVDNFAVAHDLATLSRDGRKPNPKRSGLVHFVIGLIGLCGLRHLGIAYMSELAVNNCVCDRVD